MTKHNDYTVRFINNNLTNMDLSAGLSPAVTMPPMMPAVVCRKLFIVEPLALLLVSPFVS